MRAAVRSRIRDEVRERRLAECRRTVEEFVVELARLTAGHDAQLDGAASRSLMTRLRSALQPFLVSGSLLRPDFGTHAELRVDGDLLAGAAPVDAWVEFDDLSMVQTGELLAPAPRRRVRLHLTLSLQPCAVTDLTVHLPAAM